MEPKITKYKINGEDIDAQILHLNTDPLLIGLNHDGRLLLGRTQGQSLLFGLYGDNQDSQIFHLRGYFDNFPIIDLSNNYKGRSMYFPINLKHWDIINKNSVVKNLYECGDLSKLSLDKICSCFVEQILPDTTHKNLPIELREGEEYDFKVFK